MTVPVAVIGIGNRHRGDDGAAAAVLDLLAEQIGNDDRVRLVELDGESVRVMQAWEGARTVWVVDAMCSGAEPGTLATIDVDRLAEIDRGGARFGGGHLMGLHDAVELARALGRLPDDLRVLGIEGERFDQGAGLSPSVRRAVGVAGESLRSEILSVLGGAAAEVSAGCPTREVRTSSPSRHPAHSR